MEASSVFDGTTDFRVWRARVENELMRYHLLGYVMVRDYDGSQAFKYNGEEVPPRTLVIHGETERPQQPMKEEASNDYKVVPLHGKLSRWDVLVESAEAKSILQRYLHPDVEYAILNKNIYDSWKMLCALYGNRNNPGAHDLYEMHRVLHRIKLGEKKGESVREFITRWEMLMQQYALATGMELTDGHRSASLVQALPGAWRPMVSSWRGVRPFVPYAELVENIVATRERIQQQSDSTNAPVVKERSSSLSAPFEMQRTQYPEDVVDKSAVSKQVAQMNAKSPQKASASTKSGDKGVDKLVEKRSASSHNNADRAVSPSNGASIDATSDASDNVDSSNGRTSTSWSEQSKGQTGSSSHDSMGKYSSEHLTKDSSSRTSKSSHSGDKYERSNSYDTRDRYYKYDKYESDRGYDRYASINRYDKYSRKSLCRYETNYDSYDRFDGPVCCFYCLKLGHHMKRCWYLKADIENGTTHELHKKYSCALTNDRNQFMVNCLEAYIEEEKRKRGLYNPSSSPKGQRSPSHHESADNRERAHVSHQRPQDALLPSYSSHSPREDQHQSSSSKDASSTYRQRSRSAFPTSEGRTLSRDPRLNRSDLSHRSSDAGKDFEPRKRSRASSCERQPQSYA
ncbi:hypothetical protein PsorP6_013585 [Peronosclerospora sorghi]|uniref:Uncharacterized protein n=1 Tax=Peronosclerospora sorghi TaxID=230839 RepID=A0ACC0VFT6_9STRA|nr:hypothetical protein PsorP6_013585 [Peronosclerospora sorghi]